MEAPGEERAEGPVDGPGNEDLAVPGLSLPAGEGLGDGAEGVGPFAVLDLEGEALGALLEDGAADDCGEGRCKT